MHWHPVVLLHEVLQKLTAALRGIVATAEAEVAALVAEVAGGAAPGDAVLVMSNGAFGGFLDRLVAALDGP